MSSNCNFFLKKNKKLGANYVTANNIECKIIVNTTHLLVVERFYFYTTLKLNICGGIEINFAANCPVDGK